jgi:hypothetical protein
MLGLTLLSPAFPVCLLELKGVKVAGKWQKNALAESSRFINSLSGTTKLT